jgi:hypothetical protein
MIERSVDGFLLGIREAQNHHNKRLRARDGVKDFLDYKYILGLINGLEEAGIIITKRYKGTPKGIEEDNREREFYGEKPESD